ncbi:unnamed protein product, partial [Iphiclides podalirius]
MAQMGRAVSRLRRVVAVPEPWPSNGSRCDLTVHAKRSFCERDLTSLLAKGAQRSLPLSPLSGAMGVSDDH